MILGKNINNISGLRFFNLIRYGTLLLIGIVFTKTGLSATEIGYYETLIFVAGAVMFFWISGLIQSLIPLYTNNKTFTTEVNNDRKSPELFNAFLLISVFSVISGLFVLLFKNFLANLLNESVAIPYLNILFIYILFSGPASFLEYVYLMKKKYKLIVKYGLIFFFIQFILVAGPAILGYGIEISLWGLVIITIFRFCWLIGLLVKYSEFRISIPFIKEHIYLGTPLVLSLFLSGSAQYIDGIIVSNKFDAATFAVFRYGAREMPLVMLLANAFSTSMISEFQKNNNLNNSLKKLKKESSKMIRYLFPLSIILLVTSNWFFPVIFNQEFAGSAVIFNIYLLVIVSRLVFPQTILIGLKKTKIILLGSSLEIILNVFFSLLLINIFGIAGIAIATIIAFYFEKLFLILYNYFSLKIPPEKYIPAKLHILYSVVLLILFFFVEKHIFI